MWVRIRSIKLRWSRLKHTQWSIMQSCIETDTENNNNCSHSGTNWCFSNHSLHRFRKYFVACSIPSHYLPWWRHQKDTFSVLLAIYTRNSPVPGNFPAHGPVTRSFDVFVDLRLNKRLSKQSWGWWFETPLRPLWRHCSDQWRLIGSGTSARILFLTILS